MRTRAVAVLTVFALLLLQMFAFISRHSVNILFSDQWDYYRPFFENLDLWTTFAWQHGPPRLGLGLVITRGLANLSGWNSTVDALAVGVALSLATVAALALKWRLFRSVSLFDATIPLLCLTLFQYEALVVTPNVSHGALPALMVFLYGLSLLINQHVRRYAAIVVLNFLLVYTGFGMFIAPITIALLSVEAYHSRADTQRLRAAAIALFLALISDLSFLVDYRFDAGVGTVRPVMGDVVDYPVYIGLMLAAFWGWHASILGMAASVAGGLLLAFVLVILFIHGRHVVRDGWFASRLSVVWWSW